jgi:glyoxylase-like metal-dependent hydrolase (beta-lactamase superfamily II)
MSSHSNRREFLKSVLAAGAAAGVAEMLVRPALARSGDTAITASRLNDRIVVFAGAGANVVAFQGPDGVLLVDGGLPEHSSALLDKVLKETGAKKVQTLINTHWHPEQTGSNEHLGKAGTKIIAHENTKLWLTYPQTEPGHDKPYGPLSAHGLPNETTYSNGALTFPNEKVDYGYLLQAHTDGDLYVYFHDSNVLVAGGVVSNEGWPIIDYETGGWIGGLVQGLQVLNTIGDDKTTIVPANGPVLTKADLKAQHDMYSTINQRLNQALRKGLGPDEAIALHPTTEFDAKWGDPTQFLNLAFRSLWGHMAPDA